MVKDFFQVNSDKNYKSNKLAKFLLVLLLVIVPMIIVWVLLGQFNILGLNWVVPLNGGYFVSQSQINQIKQIAPSIPDLDTSGLYTWKPPEYISNNMPNDGWNNAILQVIPNFGKYTIFNALVLIPVFSILLFDILVVLLITFLSKKIYLDIFPMLISSWFGMFMMIICGLIPQKEAYTIPVIILVIAVSWILSLICLNLLFNKIIIHSRFAEIYYEKLLREYKDTKYYEDKYKESKKNINPNDEKDYVEIETN